MNIPITIVFAVVSILYNWWATKTTYWNTMFRNGFRLETPPHFLSSSKRNLYIFFSYGFFISLIVLSIFISDSVWAKVVAIVLVLVNTFVVSVRGRLQARKRLEEIMEEMREGGKDVPSFKDMHFKGVGD